MPELPEVEAFRTYIQSTSTRKKIMDVTCHDKRLLKGASLAGFKKALRGHTFTSAERVGKYVVLSVSKSDTKVVMHFGLTGSVDFQQNGENAPRYAQVIFSFENGSALFWIEKRKFGRVWLVDQPNAIKGLSDLGKDALKITQKQFIEIAHASARKNVKAFLMDQTSIAGIGNEYSDEILFQSGIDPHHRMQDISLSDLKKFYKHMHKVLAYAIKLRVQQIKKKHDVPFTNEDKTQFPSSYLQAHRHTDHKCPKNKKHTLKKVTIAGRSAYYCPKDQK